MNKKKKKGNFPWLLFTLTCWLIFYFYLHDARLVTLLATCSFGLRPYHVESSGSRTDLRRQTASSLVSTGLGDRLGILGAVSFLLLSSLYISFPSLQHSTPSIAKTFLLHQLFLSKMLCKCSNRHISTKEWSNRQNNGRFGFLASSSFKWHHRQPSDVPFKGSNAGLKMTGRPRRKRLSIGKSVFVENHTQ